MGTDKRERQKQARQAKIEQESAAAKKQRTFRTVRNVVIAAVVVLGGAFAYSSLAGDDDEPDEATAAEDEGGADTTLPPIETTTTSIDPASFSNPEVAEEVLGREAPDPEPPPEDTAADALEITTVIEGEGEGAVAGDTVVAHYVGKTPDGEVLDESWSTGAPLTIPAPLGQGGVIKGWDEGLVGAKIGERRRLVIGSDNAYQEGPLAFEVDIVDIVPAAG